MSVLRRMYRGETEFNFVELSKRTLIVSLVLVAASILIILVRPFSLSIDFTGGVIVSAENVAGATIPEIRDTLREIGHADAWIQLTDDHMINVRTESLDAAAMDLLVATVAQSAGITIDETSMDAVGPTFGAEVTRKAIQALIVFIFVVALFITWRFEWKMAIAALAALVHDLIITAGLYALIGFTVTPATVIAILTIMGYSLYDTVVVLDKVTDNVTEMHEKSTYSGIVNLSMNQVLMRSINTSMTSLLPVGALLLIGFLAIGAETLTEFALALFVGIAVGTYSSIFVAAPILARWKETEPDWQRQVRRAERSTGVSEAISEVEPVAAPFGPPPPTAAARPPKQRRKRR